MKTIYTHKTKGTKLTFVKHFDAKTIIVLTEEGQEISMAAITLNRWYDVTEEAEAQVEEVKAEETKEMEVTQEIQEAIESRRNRMISLNDLMEAAYMSASATINNIECDLYAYGADKSDRIEAVIEVNGDYYRFGTVFNPETKKVASSYYLKNDSKAGFESIQRKSPKVAAPFLAAEMNMPVETVLAAILKSRVVFQGDAK